MHLTRFVALNGERLVTVASQQAEQLIMVEAAEDGRIGDLVSVEMQNWQNGAVMTRVKKLVRVP
jgi:hypothetical protein